MRNGHVQHVHKNGLITVYVSDITPVATDERDERSNMPPALSRSSCKKSRQTMEDETNLLVKTSDNMINNDQHANCSKPKGAKMSKEPG
jgi:hypothetical protein